MELVKGLKGRGVSDESKPGGWAMAGRSPGSMKRADGSRNVMTI